MDYVMLAGLCLMIIGSFILGFTLFRSKGVIRGMSGTFFNSNPILEGELLKERNKAIWGISFTASGFIVQVIGYILHILNIIS